MHGIQRHQHDQLMKYLVQLEEESKTLQLPCDHLNRVIQHAKKMKDLYGIYQDTLQRVGILVKQYELEQKATRRIIVFQKKYLKELS